MTIQDGDINKHLDEKPPKDKVFIWSLIIVIVIIVILLVILFKPEIFTNILDKFVPEEVDNTTEVTNNTTEDEDNYIPEDVIYIDVTKAEADKYYDIAYYMSEYLKTSEYLFTNDAINNEYYSIWTKEKETFSNWFTLNDGYNTSIKLLDIPDDEPIESKVVSNNIEYKKTSKYFKEEDLRSTYYKIFKSDYNYTRLDEIGYHGCYKGFYNANLDGYVMYQSTKACKGGLYSVNFNLTKAEVIDNFMYLYEVSLEDNKTYMYTLEKENDIYKFVSRIVYEEEVDNTSKEETPTEENN